MDEQQQQQSVAERFQKVRPDQFREQLVGLRQAEDSLRDAIIESVENGWITPLQGVRQIQVTSVALYGLDRPEQTGAMDAHLAQQTARQ